MKTIASVAEVRRAGITIEAEEAVAIAQQLMAVLRNGVDADVVQPPYGPPTPENVYLDEDGSVICRACHTTPAVSEMAIFLQACRHAFCLRLVAVAQGHGESSFERGCLLVGRPLRIIGEFGIEFRGAVSVLCVPILRQSVVTAILYLENDLVIGAFRHDQVEILRILASQAAISLDNSQLAIM